MRVTSLTTPTATRQYIDGAPGAPGRTDWRYRYSAGGEREQKRQYYTPNGDNGGNGYRWTYYLLGGKKEQLSVWEGYQIRDWLCGEQPNQWGYVYLWGKEYLTYGVGGTASVVKRPNGETDYRIADHLGSVRVSYTTPTAQTQTMDYAPFGNILPQGGAVTGLPSRKEFIDRERDGESGLGNFGVRQYEYETGRFLGVDRLWEQYRGLMPYHYSLNNPLQIIDPSGYKGQYKDEAAKDVTKGAINGAINLELLMSVRGEQGVLDVVTSVLVAEQMVTIEYVDEHLALSEREQSYAKGAYAMARVELELDHENRKVIGAKLLVGKDFYGAQSHEQIRAIVHEFFHLVDFFGDGGYELAIKAMKEKESVHYLDRDIEKRAIEYSDFVGDYWLRIRDYHYLEENLNWPISVVGE